MADNTKHTKKPLKPAMGSEGSEKIAEYARASYFKEKDKKAAAFLKKHPIPGKFLK
ncbi:MAG: hypothetical protein ABI675_14590 [Chitinophagaceae bacterium]